VFWNRFGSEPIVIESPARVNLIGEHTDYNEGFVLPAAIDRNIVLAMASNNLNIIRLHAADMGNPEFEIQVSEQYEKSGRGWPDYVLGIMDQLQKRGFDIGGFDCMFGGNIPIGAGLSSSAALEGGVITGLNNLFELELSALEMVKIGQQAENQFVGVQCGIMDQFANLFGKSGKAIQLDCRSLEYIYCPFNQEDIAILLCDTNIRRELATSEYNIRRKQCTEGVEILKEFDPSIKSLRNVSIEYLELYKDLLSEVVYKRCRFVLDENQRVLDACDDLLNDDIESFGKRMNESHDGLKNLYEVSCPQLDLLVDSVETLDAVYGSRMMGGGFGGCTINLVLKSEIDHVIDTIKTRYATKMNTSLDFYIVEISNGAEIADVTDKVKRAE